MLSFPEACWGGALRSGVGILESSVFLLNDLADMFNWEFGSWVVCRRGGLYSVVQWTLLRKGDGCFFAAAVGLLILLAVKETIISDGLRGCGVRESKNWEQHIHLEEAWLFGWRVAVFVFDHKRWFISEQYPACWFLWRGWHKLGNCDENEGEKWSFTWKILWYLCEREPSCFALYAASVSISGLFWTE